MGLYELLASWSNWAWPLLVNHIWQATLFSLFALAAATSLRRAPACARYLVWFMALVKFALPSACIAFLLSKAGVDLTPLTRPAIHAAPSTLDFSPILSPVASPAMVLHAGAPSARDAAAPLVQYVAATQQTGHLYGVLTCLWLAGCILLLISWFRRRRLLSAALKKGGVVSSGRESESLSRVKSWFGLRQDVRLVITPAIAEPGVWRVWRPVVMLPEGVTEQLDDAELEAVLMHELAHVARWDNLVGNLQRLLCCLFWFHPFIWLIDRRLLAEREQACDDTVVRLGGSSEVYANGITKVCRYCLGWEVAGHSRAAGSDLGKRLERILSGRAGKRLSPLQLAVIGVCVAGALVFSVVAGQVKGGTLGTGIVYNSAAVADTRFEVGEPALPPRRSRVREQPQERTVSKQGDANSLGQTANEFTSPVTRAKEASDLPLEVRATTGSIENPRPLENPNSSENLRAMLGADLIGPAADIPAPEEPQTQEAQIQEPQTAPADNIRAAIVKAAAVDYGDKRKLIGRYEVDPQKVENFILDITLEQGELWLKPSHAPRRRLVRQSETDFSDAYSNFQFTCILDDMAQVVGLRLNSWGRNITARKLTLPTPSLKGNVTFRLRGYSDARVVAVAGNFNNWNQSQLLFARDGDEWVCRVNLPPGTYQYKFIVDGNWLTDPNNPKIVHDERGIENSLLRTE